MKNITNSPIDKITFKNHNFLIKRDDLLHEDFNGNKARKFYYFLENNFPNIKTLISYGSNQSNSMYSLSVLAKLKNWNFKYYTNHLPSFLIDTPSGNYKYSLENGMDIIVGEYDSSTLKVEDTELLVSEGGAISEAKCGIEILAKEIKEYKKLKNIKNLKVFLPSGTGTTSLFLQQYLDDEVLTVPCVGNSEYLTLQFSELIKDKLQHPTILEPSKKYHFGKLYKENYEIHKELKEDTNIEFDLLYDSIGWNTILNYFEDYKDDIIMYIHQGGVKGNETMLERYMWKYDK
ncbi:MAG TPA: 1-aminocyclopropane-1-carboxylate deaminase [Arcobacter sp.]|nr:1-aminocyclopropane-1-carboxylate deaminase [Arcobacter sp.]HIP56442.1 1-aminocyclopropane-1-carboxylate deaminase [Arcobacter sp.]